VQRRLREMAGVTVLIYEQTCAAEKRRRRKKGELVDPARRLFINDRVCEGCGDCTVQSNCVAVQPLETPLGRKRKIDQSSCNKDYSCAKGFCPSFVGVLGGKPRKRAGALASGADEFMQRVDALPRPARTPGPRPYDLLVTGVGGTGVVTVGALIAMAAHLEGKSASVLDFMGFAQKGGSVLSFVRLADVPARLNQVRIDTQQADALLACDLVVGASPEALGRCAMAARASSPTRTKCRWPRACATRTPPARAGAAGEAALRRRRRSRRNAGCAGAGREPSWATPSISNIVALGFAWQRGLVPVSLEALLRAIELNGVAVDNNKLAFSLGRLAAADRGDRCAGCAARRRKSAGNRERSTALDRARRRAPHRLPGRGLCAPLRRLRGDACARGRRRWHATQALPFTRAVAQAC
jgi:indolepyruvate ferredoxin oxidoreductase